MPQVIPTTQEIVDASIAKIEAKLNQETPLQDAAFNRVMAIVLSLGLTSLYKYGVDRQKQAFALSATDIEALQVIGEEFEVPIKPEEKAVLKVSVVADTGTVIPSTVNFLGDLNQIVYTPDAEVTSTGGVAILTVTATEAGIVGNLKVGDGMTLDRQIFGAATTGTVSEIVELGVDPESVESYKARVLFAERAQAGGGSPSDYKVWSEAVAGVRVAYPFSGRPFDSPDIVYPGDRVIYIQSETFIDPDGLAPPELLADVREALNIDPETGLTRPPMGLVDSTLFLQSIIRNSYYVEIRGARLPEEFEGQILIDIQAALVSYFDALRPFVTGIDTEVSRNDTITALAIGEIVQQILRTYGGSVEEILFGPNPGLFIPRWSLLPNELAKLGGITYVG